jgi:hypothetical protein
LTLFLGVFLNNLLPIFLCAGAGFAVGRAFQIDLKTVTRLSFFIFSPCLVFTALTQAQVGGGELGQLALFTVLVLAAMMALSALTGLALRLERHLLMTLIIASVFVNGGNYGLAANRFAFGEEALARAVIFYVVSTIGVYTAGIFVASLGKQSVRQALREVVSMPAFYAVIAAGAFRLTGWQVPLFFERAITLLGEAAIPVMLVILGLQIAQTRAWPRARFWLIGVASGLQLLVAPLVGIALAALLGLTGPARQAAILEASMPTAVITTILALQYDLDAELVTGTVIVSTLLSPLVLTPLIVYLQHSG